MIIILRKIHFFYGGFAGEVGHVSVNPRGMLCACGQRGCIEVYTSEDNALKNMGVQDIHQLNALLD